MKLHNIKSAIELLDVLYGVTVSESEFETMALVAWELIGTKHTKLHRYVGKVEDKTLELPCNVDVIESVHIPVSDSQVSSSSSSYPLSENISTEHYIANYNKSDNLYYNNGKLVNYDVGDGVLYFKKNYPKVEIIYHGILVDEDGLPLVNEKELKAIAAYVAYSYFYKDGLKKRNGDSLQLAQTVKADWLKYCNAARIPDHLSQNDMDSILDVKFRWDRKMYGKSFKPHR